MREIECTNVGTCGVTRNWHEYGEQHLMSGVPTGQCFSLHISRKVLIHGDDCVVSGGAVALNWFVVTMKQHCDCNIEILERY